MSTTDTKQDPEKLLTTEQAAALLTMSSVYVHDRAVGRKLPIIPSYKFGNRLRFKRADVLQYAEENFKTAVKKSEPVA